MYHMLSSECACCKSYLLLLTSNNICCVVEEITEKIIAVSTASETGNPFKGKLASKKRFVLIVHRQTCFRKREINMLIGLQLCYASAIRIAILLHLLSMIRMC